MKVAERDLRSVRIEKNVFEGEVLQEKGQRRTQFRKRCGRLFGLLGRGRKLLCAHDDLGALQTHVVHDDAV